MTKMTIGIDPDSDKCGVAVYINGKLTELMSLDVFELDSLLRVAKDKDASASVHIEDLCAVSYSGFATHGRDSLSVKLKKAESVGKCKQVQKQVETLCDTIDVKLHKHQISKMWKDSEGKKYFQTATGWEGKSNADTRSAAYFGWLGLKSCTK